MDQLRLATQPATVTLDDCLSEDLSHAKQLLRANGVLEAGQRRLGGQSIAFDRVAVDEHLVDGVGGKPGGVIAVRIAAGNGENSLLEYLSYLVSDLAGLAIIAQTLGEPFGQVKPLVAGLQKNGTTVGAAVGLVEFDDEGLAKKIREQNRLLRGRFGQSKASVVWKVAVASTFYHMEAFVCSEFVNYPG